jgi:hypothetical protein
VAFGTISRFTTNQIHQIITGLLSTPDHEILLVMRKDQQHLNGIKDTDEIEKLYENRIKIFEWVNQQYVLSHPSVKLFFTHAGFQSVIESIKYEVPVLCFPFFGDQPLNSIKVFFFIFKNF